MTPGGGHGHGRDHDRGCDSRCGRHRRAEGPDRLCFGGWVSLKRTRQPIDKAMLEILILQAMRLYHSASDSIHNHRRPARGAATWNCDGSYFVLGRSLDRSPCRSLDHGLGRGISPCRSGAACRLRTLWRCEMRKTGNKTKNKTEKKRKKDVGGQMDRLGRSLGGRRWAKVGEERRW